MARNKQAFFDANANVIIVARDNKQNVNSQWNAARHDLNGFYGIAEPDHELGKLYKQQNGEGNLLPAQFIIGQDGLIKFVNYAGTQTAWTSPANLLSELENL